VAFAEAAVLAARRLLSSRGMLQNDGSQLPNGSVYLLTSLQGAFVNSSFTDGVFIDRASSGMWSMTASNGRSGWALCIQ
jgi:hypothetical protein